MARIDLMICGLGGQGVITAGYILGQAACLFDHRNAMQTQSYGPEARGSACCTEVTVSDGEIDYPARAKLDVLVAMSQDAYDQYVKSLSECGILIVDSDNVELDTVGLQVKVYKIPATKTAETELRSKLAANMVMLGAITAITQIVSPEAAIKSITERFPRSAEINLKAFQRGVELGNAAQKAQKTQKQ